jgi:hypothetical protein
MATVFRIDVDIGHLIPLMTGMQAGDLPALDAAVRKLAEAAQQQWIAYASGAPLPGGKAINSRTGEYARSITLRQLSEFSAEIYSELPYAEAIERGSPSYDMKRMLGSSWKVRSTKSGKRYLIIPFRWDHENSVIGSNHMPQAATNWWRQGRTPSAVTGEYRRVSGAGGSDVKTRGSMTTEGWRYKWGDRLSRGTLAHLGVTGAPAKRMAGMVNFRKPGGKGGGSHSQFLTFRVMMEGSKGWIAPAREGLWPARTTAEQIRPLAEKAFAEAVTDDVRRHLGG